MPDGRKWAFLFALHAVAKKRAEERTKTMHSILSKNTAVKLLPCMHRYLFVFFTHVVVKLFAIFLRHAAQ